MEPAQGKNAAGRIRRGLRHSRQVQGRGRDVGTQGQKIKGGIEESWKYRYLR